MHRYQLLYLTAGQGKCSGKREGFAKFVSVQSHYNLIFREEEPETAPFCREENIAMTPYSSLVGGRLVRLPGESSRRLCKDSYARLKHDISRDQDSPILARVTTPVVGTTRVGHIESAAKRRSLP